ncbi:hypothetical protein ACMG4J_22730 [Rossellomorea marisflavi]|uniref:hypothetical protein n=1 Tax=Rossellomorea marisflavi TaxID=189381 RepID=UPI0039BF9B6F
MKHKPLAPINITGKSPFQSVRPTSSGADRKTRYDKKAVMRFPVTEEQHKQLRTAFAKAKREPGPSPESITEFLIMVVRFGLRHPEMLSLVDPYENGVNKKTVKPNQVEKSMIEELAIDWNVSERRAVHGIVLSVLNYLSKGGVLRDEKVQPFRPSK